MVQSRTLNETNPSVPTKPLREGEAYNLGDLMPATPSSALASGPMTGQYKGKEKEIASESPRYPQPSLVANGSQYGHQEMSNYTAINPGYRFEEPHPPPTEQVPVFCTEAFGRVVPNNGLGLPSPIREIFLLDTQFNYPALESQMPSQSTVANANASMASTSAQRASYLNQSIEHTHSYESLSQYIDSLFFNDLDFYYYYVKRTSSLYLPVIDFSIHKTPDKANHVMNGSSMQSNQQLNLVPEQHQTIVEPSIIHPTTNTSPQSSASRSTSGATTARGSHDNTLLTVTQDYSATDAITTLSCPENIKEETELHQSSSFAMRAPELTRSQSIGMDDLSPHYDQEMSGDDDSYDYLDAEDLLVPDASITALDVGLDITPIEQGVRFPGDQYTPVWVRFQGKRRQGRCEQCVHLNRKILWFKMRTSQYLYHKLNAHGIIHATGRPFGKPTDVRLNVDGTREGWCHYCNTFQMAYTPRSRPPMSRWAPWYRHVYNCHPVCSYRKRSRVGHNEHQ